MDIIQFFGRFHVLVLHLPIGILLLAALLELHIAFLHKERVKLLNQIWFWGAVSAVCACILGYLLSLGGGYNDEAVFVHKSFGISVAVIAIVCTLIFSYKKYLLKAFTTMLVSLQLFLLFATGHYGANMTHGETYLVEHAPNFIRTIAGFEPHQAPRPAITELAQADIYLDLVKPIFQKNCVSCHNDAKAKGKLNLANIEGIAQGGKSANTLGNGALESSELYTRITLDEHDKEFMPAEGKTPLTELQVKAIAWWIQAGAPLSGTLKTAELSKQDFTTLSQYLGLRKTKDAWPLPKQSDIPADIIAQLQKHRFLVKTIASDVNYLDVDYSSNLDKISDDAIKALVQSKQYIAYLNLTNSHINSVQLAELSALTNLLRLRLNKIPIDDNSIQTLENLPNLKYLNLFGTQITDSTLKILLKFNNLEQVYLGQTKVTETGLQQLAASHPSLQIFGLSPQLAAFQQSTQSVLDAKQPGK